MIFFLKFIKFGVVGFSGLIIDFLVTYFFKEKLKLNRFLSNSVGFSIAASSNYILNRLWTFHSHNQEVFIEFSVFIMVSVIGLLINNFFLYLFEKRMNFYLAKLLAISVTTLWNFFANYLITFNL